MPWDSDKQIREWGDKYRTCPCSYGVASDECDKCQEYISLAIGGFRILHPIVMGVAYGDYPEYLKAQRAADEALKKLEELLNDK